MFSVSASFLHLPLPAEITFSPLGYQTLCPPLKFGDSSPLHLAPIACPPTFNTTLGVSSDLTNNNFHGNGANDGRARRNSRREGAGGLSLDVCLFPFRLVVSHLLTLLFPSLQPLAILTPPEALTLEAQTNDETHAPHHPWHQRLRQRNSQ